MTVRLKTLLALALLAAIVCGGYTFLRGSFSCAFDTSYCASSSERVRHAGRFFTNDGRPIGDTTISVSFESLKDSSDPALEFPTDSIGRFCFMWPVEGIIASADVARTESTAAPDPRFLDRERLLPQSAQPRGLGQLADRYPVLLTDPRTPLRGSGHTAVTGWNPATDSAPTCVTPDRGPPWYRVKEPTENWRYILLLLLAVGAAGLIVLTFLERGRRRQTAMTLALATLGLQAVLTVVLWDLYV